jgi:hypothetical protein
LQITTTGSAKMEIGQNYIERDAPSRPALATLIGAMAKLPRYQRLEICLLDRRAKAARAPRLRRLAREARAEAKRLAQEASQ